MLAVLERDEVTQLLAEGLDVLTREALGHVEAEDER